MLFLKPGHCAGRGITVTQFRQSRAFLKSDRWAEWAETETDQRKGLPPPPFEKPVPPGATLIDLVPPGELTIGTMSLIQAIGRRRSRRHWTAAPLSLQELSFLLWATQGYDPEATEARLAHMRQAYPESPGRAQFIMRTVPSGGARHPFETYLVIQRVGDLAPGLYRYISLQHKLLFLRPVEAIAEAGEKALADWFTEPAVIFIWTVIPARTEWRYSFISPKLIAQDSGHICQNLYLACESIGAGACAVAGYDQDPVDDLVGVDGQEEFTIYLAPVGKVDREQKYHF
jgi:SagB-type dehydrogenase family enzyme